MSNIGFRVIENIKRPEKDLIEKFKKYCTANIADNMNRFFCMDEKIKMVNSNNVKMVGPAFTVKTRVADNLLVHKAINLAKPGDVIVIDAEGDTNHAILGEIMVREAVLKKFAGYIVDGSIRDIGEISKLDYPVFAKSSIPRGPYKDGPGEINIPITCGGVVVNPGDIIVGDVDGIVVISPEYAEEILLNTEQKCEKEQSVLASLKAGTPRDKSWVDKVLIEKGCQFE